MKAKMHLFIIPQWRTLLIQGFLITLFIATSIQVWASDKKVVHDIKVFKVQGKEFLFGPKVLTAKKGQQITIEFTNDGVLAHNFAIESLQLKTETIQTGETSKLTFKVDNTGSYKIRCMVPGHMEAGMTGLLIIEK